MLPVKKHLENLVRVPNSAETRRKFLRLDKNENILGFPSEFMDILYREIDPDFVNTYPALYSLYATLALWVVCTRDIS